jgi:hypothetical protein
MDSFTTLVNIVFTQSVTPSVILMMYRPAELKPQIYFFLLCTYCNVIHQLLDDKQLLYTPVFNTIQFRPDVGFDPRTVQPVASRNTD